MHVRQQSVGRLMLDDNVVSAISLWYSKGIDAGGFAMSLLAGERQEALERAHKLLKPHFEDHAKYVESLPIEGRGENMKYFKGGIELSQ